VPAAARPWLADQRAMHGLLRALHTPDAAAREGRVAAILQRIDADAQRSPRRHWLAVAGLALLLACAGVWLALPATLPTAEAAMRRATSELARDVARRFQVGTARLGADGRELGRQQFAVVTRPGGRFRLSGRFGAEFTIGSDGEEVWMIGANGAFRHAVPVAERERLQRRFGDVIDLGYLDVHDLLRKLPADFELRMVGRETDAAGRSVLRVEATRRSTAQMQLRSAWLTFDEATGMVLRLEAEAERAGGQPRRLSIEYLGEEPPGLVEFGRPW
jgi:hypothetical protein